MVATDPARISPATVSTRIVGIDLARAVAMLGMVIAHYTRPDGSGDLLDDMAGVVTGRAMPLFVMLGGVGATILSSRARQPDRALLIRAAMLYPAGVILQELTTVIAIILQSYALLFALAPLFRRLSNRSVLSLAVVVTAAGSWSYQVVGPALDTFEGPSDLLTNPMAQLWSLLFNGIYPFFPVGAFFLVGLYLGRLDLRSSPLARWLAVGGALIGVASVVAAERLTERLGVILIGRPELGGGFRWGGLLDTTGHSEMPAWVVSATATSAAVLGISLLVAPQLPRLLRPMVALGRLALSFYVFQAVLIRFTPDPAETALSQEFLTALAVYLGFMIFAALWTRRFSVGPLEAAFRLGSGRGAPVRAGVRFRLATGRPGRSGDRPGR